ncbi:MAG: preprotein translocase subunit YajC [Bacteroidetes bacterium]|nr:preprotein translocase subunit YajC [Bacteroidota bacterium]
MNNLLYVLLMAPRTEDQNPLMTFLPLILIIVVFYFFMIRPQVQKQKDLRKYRESLNKGDKIITTGGIYGKVVDIKDNTIIIDVGEQVRLKIDKSAVLKDAADLTTRK